MAQLFHRRANAVAKACLIGGMVFTAAVGAGFYTASRSAYWTRIEAPIKQPVPFSHEHHVAGLGMDCRYCHTSVEKSPCAGLPPTEICMTCHSQVWKDAPMLQPVRDSLQNGTPLRWTRVHDLPDYVYFDHSIHVSKGVGCASCHGRVDQMPITWKTQELTMRWCLDCHRAPEKFLRPRDQVFSMIWEPPAAQKTDGAKLVQELGIHTAHLTDCATCHR